MTETNQKPAKGAKKAAILNLFHSGITKVSEIVESLKAQGIETSKNNVHVVLAELRKPKAVAVADETPHGQKAALIRAELAKGNEKPADIVKALAEQGVTVSAAHVATVKSKSKTPAQETAVAAPKPKAKAAPKEASTVHPDLLKLMQAAALQFGSGAVSAAASHVDARSREMIKATFGG